MITEFARDYIDQIQETLNQIDIDDLDLISKILWDAYLSEKQIFVMGNGGSASIASHFACDLSKNTVTNEKVRFRVQSLNDNIPLMTALSNDGGYECIFIEQLKNLVRPGDVVIAVSSAGNSPNILQALEYANIKQATTIAITGFGGGKANDIADFNLILNNSDYGIVETAHTFICHTISFFFKRQIMNHNGNSVAAG